SVLGIEPNPEAYEHARLKYPRVAFRRAIAETFEEPCDAIVFLQTIEHVADPDAVLEHFKAQLSPDGVAFVSTPNVLTLAPPGAERSGNPWHVKEYRAEGFRALCEAHFGDVDLLGLFHARKLRLHQLAIERAGARPATASPCGGAPVTLSLTPVLCDQLQAPGVTGRFAAFVRGVRRASHRLDAGAARRAGDEDVARAIEDGAGQYEDALERFGRLGGDLLGALASYATWTSAATHAVLPLLATDSGVRLQVRSGIESHRRRTGRWAGGFWLPECAHSPQRDPLLAGEGVCATCVDLTGVIDDHLRPLRSDAGVVLWPIDRAIVELVWSPDGYPSHAAYR